MSCLHQRRYVLKGFWHNSHLEDICACGVHIKEASFQSFHIFCFFKIMSGCNYLYSGFMKGFDQFFPALCLKNFYVYQLYPTAFCCFKKAFFVFFL